MAANQTADGGCQAAASPAPTPLPKNSPGVIKRTFVIFTAHKEHTAKPEDNSLNLTPIQGILALTIQGFIAQKLYSDYKTQAYCACR